MTDWLRKQAQRLRDLDSGSGDAQQLEAAANRIDDLLATLKAARPYVLSFAENCPLDDGGIEAKYDLEIIDNALNS